MACSPAQLESNRRNAQLSTGPRTASGKSRSRMNAIKHSLTGAGIALPNEVAEEVERRFETLQAEMRPNSELARRLVGRVALLLLRLDRSAEHEAKALAHRMRKAAAEFDAARLAEVDRLMAWIGAEPVTNARVLRTTPEGIDRLIAAISGLRSDLTTPYNYIWSGGHCERLHDFMGRRSSELPVPRIKALTDAIAGDFRYLRESDGEGLETKERRVWAIGQLVALMDDELAALAKLREGLDLEGIELDRAEAASRAMFDGSKEAVLARKYEGASERGMFRTLREFREVQAETSSDPQVAAELGSFSPELIEEEIEAADVDPIWPEVDEMDFNTPADDDPTGAEASAVADPDDPTDG